MSIADQITKQMMTEIDREYTMSMMINNLFADRDHLVRYLTYLLDRDFDYISPIVINFVAQRSSIGTREMDEMFTSYIQSYQTLHGIYNTTKWRDFVINNQSDYEQHLLGIMPELREVSTI